MYLISEEIYVNLLDTTGPNSCRKMVLKIMLHNFINFEYHSFSNSLKADFLSKHEMKLSRWCLFWNICYKEAVH